MKCRFQQTVTGLDLEKVAKQAVLKWKEYIDAEYTQTVDNSAPTRFHNEMLV